MEVRMRVPTAHPGGLHVSVTTRITSRLCASSHRGVSTRRRRSFRPATGSSPGARAYTACSAARLEKFVGSIDLDLRYGRGFERSALRVAASGPTPGVAPPGPFALSRLTLVLSIEIEGRPRRGSNKGRNGSKKRLAQMMRAQPSHREITDSTSSGLGGASGCRTGRGVVSRAA